jgi:hypothetical protein
MASALTYKEVKQILWTNTKSGTIGSVASKAGAGADQTFIVQEVDDINGVATHGNYIYQNDGDGSFGRAQAR